MKSIIDDFYYGNGFYSEKIPERKEFKRVCDQRDEEFDKLINSASEEQKKLLINFDMLSWSVTGEACADRFAQGFRLGVLLACEIFQK